MESIVFFLQNLGGNIVEVEGPAFAESISEGDIRWQKRMLSKRQ